MTSIGDTLRRQRLRNNLDLEQISRETKISVRMLEAIEDERFDRLPGGVFTKSFVRQYARALGLDESEIVSELGPLTPAVETAPVVEESARQEIVVPRVSGWSPGRKNSSLSALALVVVVMLLCSGIYAWWQRSRGPAAAEPPLSASREATPPAVAAPAPAPAPASQPPAQAKPVQPAVLHASGLVQLQLSATEETWISAKSGEKQLFTGTLQPNQTRTVESADTIRLVIGNAGGVTLTLNGKPLGALGRSGEVTVVNLSAAGVQTVPRTPPAPDLL